MDRMECRTVGVRMSLEYRMVATTPDGRLKRWCFAKEPQARKHLADLIRDIKEKPLCGYSDPYLEEREVGEWRTVNSSSPAG